MKNLMKIAILGAVITSCTATGNSEDAAIEAAIGHYVPLSKHHEIPVDIYMENLDGNERLFSKYKNEIIPLNYENGVFKQDHAFGGVIVIKNDTLMMPTGNQYKKVK